MELFTPFLSLQHDRRSRTSIAGTVCEGSVIFGTYRNPATSADSAADVTCISGRGKSVEHTDLLLLSSPIGLPQHWPFIKMHGLENYFVILDRRDGNKPLNVEDIVRICSNNTGVGGEQLLTIEPASDEGLKAGAYAAVRIFNIDGREVGVCGNATRWAPQRSSINRRFGWLY